MSFDLALWYPQNRLDNKQAGVLYVCLCDGDTSGVVAHPAVDAFYAELIAIHPEIDTIPEEKIDDHDYCPWSCQLDRSPGHLIVCCVWSKATDVYRLVESLAGKHGLALYDPQSDAVIYPDGSRGAKPASRGAFWILGFFALLCSAIFAYSEHLAPSRIPLLGYVFAALCAVMGLACFRQARK